MLDAGIALAALGLIVMRAANKANNDGAWLLYGFIPAAIGALLIIVGIW